MKTSVLTDDCQMKLHRSTVGSGNANACLTGDILESGKCYVGKPQNTNTCSPALKLKVCFLKVENFTLANLKILLRVTAS